MVSGEMLDTASATFDQNNNGCRQLCAEAAGAKRFGKVTATTLASAIRDHS